MLRDTLAAAAGLEQTILATAGAAPVALRGEIRGLAGRLERGERLPAALRTFAEQVADPTADLVVSALVLAAEHQARQLADLLGELAREAREQVAMRLRIDAGRARTRTSVRVIVGTTLAFAAGLIVLNRPYLHPYDDAGGQLVLLLVGGLFAVAFWWLARIGQIAESATGC
jgi:Flp pilus assembly protein TadB